MQTLKVFYTSDIDNRMWLESRRDYGLSNDCFVKYTVAEEVEWDEKALEFILDDAGMTIPIITEVDQMLIDAGASAGETIIVEHMW